MHVTKIDLCPPYILHYFRIIFKKKKKKKIIFHNLKNNLKKEFVNIYCFTLFIDPVCQ